MLHELLVNYLSKRQSEKADVLDIYFCYRLLLGRKADDHGWLDWTKRVSSGMTCAQLVNGFLESHEFRMKRTFRKKVRVETPDFIIYADPDDVSAGVLIINEKTYEPHVTNVIRNLLRNDSVYIDVGCNIGWFVLLGATIAKQGKVVGIEPNYHNLQLLYQSVSENRFTNVVIMPYAVTDSTKILQMGGFAGYSFVRNDGAGDLEANYVQGYTLDYLLRDIERVDIIKMDIEGHEPIALNGMKTVITRYRPTIVSEFHPKLIEEFSHVDPQSYLDDLQSLGYKLAVIEASSRIVECSSTAAVMECWYNLNQTLGTGNLMHVDLLAVPTHYSY